MQRRLFSDKKCSFDWQVPYIHTGLFVKSLELIDRLKGYWDNIEKDKCADSPKNSNKYSDNKE